MEAKCARCGKELEIVDIMWDKDGNTICSECYMQLESEEDDITRLRSDSFIGEEIW